MVLNDWKGTGYLILNPETGEGAYRISGGLSGDSTSTAVTIAGVCAPAPADAGILWRSCHPHLESYGSSPKAGGGRRIPGRIYTVGVSDVGGRDCRGGGPDGSLCLYRGKAV